MTDQPLIAAPLPPAIATLAAFGLELRVTGEPGPFRVGASVIPVAEGVAEIALAMESEAPAVPPVLRLCWRQPACGVQALWRSDRQRDKGLPPYWWDVPGVRARGTSQAPAFCLLGQDGTNRLTVAADEVLRTVRLGAAVVEETGDLQCEVAFHTEARTPVSSWRGTVRLDNREVPFHRALDAASRWWEAQPGGAPAPVPEAARRPMYSTWYAFHHDLDADLLVAECARARELGCEAIIVDDGWQHHGGRNGYWSCGDWQDRRFPMRPFVDRVHALGMQVLLWYAVPFIGFGSAAYPRFAGRYLREDRQMGAAVLDPRYPEVRAHLIGLYARAQADWGLDGFKLDFVDSFTPGPETPVGAGDGRDCADIEEGVDRLLRGVLERLRARNPQVLVEFRQGYIGPAMRTYGNLFRAGDCPHDAVANRVSTIDVRLLCGASAAHADMLMWHAGDSAESAALQLLNVLFAVPQMSVRLDRLPAGHRAMAAFWLGWWLERRQVLLDGELRPSGPQLNYPVVEAAAGADRVLAVYGDAVARPAPGPIGRVEVVNATAGGAVIIDLPADLGRRRIVVRDCRGTVVADAERALPAGPHRIAVPPAGLAAIASG